MTEVERLAEFAIRASYYDLSEAARDQLKIRVLDSAGCAIGALSGEPVQLVRAHAAEFDRGGACPPLKVAGPSGVWKLPRPSPYDS